MRSTVASTALFAWCVFCCGCAAVPLPAIDPTGERILLPSPSYTTLVSPYDSNARYPCLPRPAFTEPPPIPPCEFAPPGRPLNIGTGVAATPQPDRLTLSPARIVAPINSEVLLLAGLCGREGHYITKQPIEWMLSPDSVGNIIALADADHPHVAKFIHEASRKECNNLALTRTSTAAHVVTRGTSLPNDDVWVSKGQTWISVSSPTEGISYITAVAKRAENWETRRQTAAIYWVDMQWVFPSPQIVPAGQPAQLETAVSKTSTGNPSSNVIVRYEVVGGSPAYFAGGRTDIRVPTDENGRAAVQVLQDPPGPGNTQIRIQILARSFRGEAGSDAVIGQGFTTVNWKAAGLAVRINGPQIVSRGSVATFGIEVSNPGDLATQKVGVRVDLPQPLKYLSSEPAARVYGNSLEWPLGDLAPHQSLSIQLNCQAGNSGEIQLSARASTDTAGVAPASARVETRIVESGVTVRFVDPPATADLGSRVEFKFEITNTGGLPLTNVAIRDVYDAGLQPDYKVAANEPVQLKIGNLGAGETVQRAITFVARTAGQSCHTLEVRADGGHSASTRACLNVTQPVLRVTVSKLGPTEARIGDVVRFVIAVTNVGQGVITNLQITNLADPSLEPISVTQGGQRRASDGAVVWTAASLSPTENLTREIECRCRAASSAAQNLVEVTADGNLRESAATRIVILPRTEANYPSAPPQSPAGDSAGSSGNLQLQFAHIGNPQVGGTAELFILLKNTGTQDVDDASIVVSLPNAFGLAKVIQNPKYQVIGDMGLVTIGPIRTIRSMDTLPPIRLEVPALKPGRYTIKVRVESRNAPPVEEEKEITIVPAV